MMNSMRTLKLGWVFHQKFKNGAFNKIQSQLVAWDDHQRPGID